MTENLLIEKNKKISFQVIFIRSLPYLFGSTTLSLIPAAISKEITIMDYPVFFNLLYKNFLEETNSMSLGFIGLLAIAVTLVSTFIKVENSDKPNEF